MNTHGLSSVARRTASAGLVFCISKLTPSADTRTLAALAMLATSMREDIRFAEWQDKRKDFRGS